MKRRQFLTRAPLAMAVVAAPVAAAEATVDLPTQTENPTLLALGADLPKTEQAYQAALKTWQAAWAEWAPQWPLAPDVCCNKYGASGYNRELERDLTGAGLRREGETCTWYIKTAEEMECDIERAREALAKDDKRKRSWGKSFRQYRYQEIQDAELGLALLPGYLAERERVRTESNFDAIHVARIKTREALFAFVRRVLTEPSHTSEGVMIKAQACAALNRMHRYDQCMAAMTDTIDNIDCMAGLLGQAMLESLNA